MSRPTASGRLVCKAREDERIKVFEYRAGEKWKRDIESIFLKKLKGCLITRKSGLNVKQRILRSKVLLFTGHHYVEAGGEIGELDGLKLGRIMGYRRSIKRSRVVDHDTNLILATGCNWLNEKTASFLAVTFPNAMVIGFATKSALVKGKFFPNFVKRLPDNLSFSGPLNVSFTHHALCRAWRKFIKDASTNLELSKGAWDRNKLYKKVRVNPTAHNPAYMMPGKRVWAWRQQSKKWDEKTFPTSNQSEKKFWGGKTWPVPDPDYQ
jgi:hypothetical protein